MVREITAIAACQWLVTIQFPYGSYFECIKIDAAPLQDAIIFTLPDMV